MPGIIFDFNGTMVFDKDLHEESWKKFINFKTGSYPTDTELKNHMHGRNADYAIPYFLKQDFSREEIAILEEEKEKIYRRMCLESLNFKLVEGLTAFLDILKERQIPFTIATASGYNNVTFFYENLKLGRWFNFADIVYNDGTIKGKPNPDIFLKAAKKIKTDIEDCIIFEDSKSGIEAAIASKAKKIIGVSSMLNKAQLLGIGVNEVITDYFNVLPLISK